MTREEVEAFLDIEFPQRQHGGRTYFVDEVGPLFARVRMDFTSAISAPGARSRANR